MTKKEELKKKTYNLTFSEDPKQNSNLTFDELVKKAKELKEFVRDEDNSRPRINN